MHRQNSLIPPEFVNMQILSGVAMKILIVTPSYFPIVGGSETLTRTLSTKLNETGIHTDVMTLNMKKKWNPIWREEIEEKDASKILKVAAVNPFRAFATNPLYSVLRVNVAPKPSFRRQLEGYDVIHFVGEADLSLILFSYFTKKPKIMHCVATYLLLEFYRKHSSLRKMFKFLFQRLADLYIVTYEGERKLLTDLGVSASKIITLPIGVDTKKFHPNETKRLNNLILFVGRIERIKGLHILIKALAYLRIPTQLTVIGPRWDEKYVKEIEKMIDETNQKGFHKVKMVGTVNQSDLVLWYQKATVVACPYLVEPYSNITREALACGTPVVSTGTHIIKQGSDGILVTSKDPKELANSLTMLLKDKEIRKKYGRQGRETVEQHLSWAAIVRNLESIYKRVSSDSQTIAGKHTTLAFQT